MLTGDRAGFVRGAVCRSRSLPFEGRVNVGDRRGEVLLAVELASEC